MKITWRRWSPLLAVAVLAVGMLAPATAFAKNDGWTVLRLVLISGDDVIYDSEDDPDGEQLPAKGGSNTDRLLFGIDSNVVHLSCSDGLPEQITLPDDGGTVTITDGYMHTLNPGEASEKTCGNPDVLQPPVEDCPHDADLAADDPDCQAPEEPEACAYDETLDADDPDCQAPEGPEACAYDETLDANDPDCQAPEEPEEPEACAYDEALDADDPDCVEPAEPRADVCPNLDGVQTEIPAGLMLDEDGDCVETSDVLDETQTREDEDETREDDEADTTIVETAVLGVTLKQTADADELPATGAGSLLSLMLAGLLSLGLGGAMLRRRDDAA
jgi:LPXTG-motif cell wall-anchored protein